MSTIIKKTKCILDLPYTILVKYPLFNILYTATKSYISKINVKYVCKVLYYSFIFKAIISILSYVVVSVALCTIETINMLIILGLVFFYTLYIIKNCKKSYKNAVIISVHLFLTLVILALFWKVLILSLPYIAVYNIYLEDNFLLMEDSNSSDNKSPSNTSSSSGNDNGGRPDKPNKPNKPNKPELTIKVGPQNDLEKDQTKIGMCTHENMSDLVMNTPEDVEATMCDFGGDFSEGKYVTHKALDSVTDHALVCDNCHSICCKDCYEEYSSSENTPIADTGNSGPSNN